ncbi:MAG: L,D-transpeptidase family protein [Acidimicrobiales bacterium]
MTQVEERPTAPPDRPAPSVRRRPALLAAVVAVLALAATAAGIGLAVAGGDETAGPATTTTAAPAGTTTAAPRPVTSLTTAPPATTAVPPTVATWPAGVKPPPLDAPVAELRPTLDGAAPVTSARASVPQVAVYAQPLAAPAAEFADWRFPATTQFGSPTVFLVTGTAGEWLRVRVPMKPNELEGWVHNSEVALAPVATRLVVELASRTVQLYDGDRLVAESISVIGTDATPTPTGLYYVTDLLQMEDPTGVYGPFVLATSARSDAFELFNGGEPIVALHGTNQPSLLGSAASNGCVRLPNDVVTELVQRTALGTPVFVV